MQQSVKFYVVRTWFVVNAVIALAPPIYWAANNHANLVLGLPATLFYFLTISLSITISILYAYWVDVSSGAFIK